MTSQFTNYVPIQGLLAVEVGLELLQSLESILESADVNTQEDLSPQESMSESVSVVLT